jgi:hypothetical protein
MQLLNVYPLANPDNLFGMISCHRKRSSQKYPPHGLTLAVHLEITGCVTSSDRVNKGVDTAQRGDFATALREWKPLAEQGVASAQYNLGLMYDRGEKAARQRKEWFAYSHKRILAFILCWVNLRSSNN